MLDPNILIAVMARRCGLQEPSAFAARPERERQGDTFADALGCETIRGTGRTTRMLLAALVALEVGCSVEIEGADRGHSDDLREQLVALMRVLGWCTAHGLDVPPVLRRCAFTCPEHIIKGRCDVRLVDHFAAEMAARADSAPSG